MERGEKMKFDKDKLLILMAEQELNPYDLCKLSGVAYQTYLKVSKGKAKPKPATIGKIAKALNVKVQDLLKD